MRDRFTGGAVWEVNVTHGSFEWTVIDGPLHKDQRQDGDDSDGYLIVSDAGIRFLFFFLKCVLTSDTASAWVALGVTSPLRSSLLRCSQHRSTRIQESRSWAALCRTQSCRREPFLLKRISVCRGHIRRRLLRFPEIPRARLHRTGCP